MQIYVVVVTYNASKWLFTCLNSLTASTVPLSVVIVDNNSSDDTLSIIDNHFKEVTLIKSGTNLGFGKANNMGISYARNQHADYIFLLNQDARVQPGTIEQLIQVSSRYPEFFILSPLHLNGTGHQLDYNFSRYAGPDYCKMLFSDFIFKRDSMKDIYETNFVNAALWLMPAACITEIGGFDPVFPHYGEDDDFINRIHYHGYKVGICPLAAGIHDRNQEPFNINKLSTGNRYKRLKVNFLISLKNINKKFPLQLMHVYKTIIGKIIKALIQLDLSNLLVYLKAFIYITIAVNKIRLHRNISKEAGAFLA